MGGLCTPAQCINSGNFTLSCETITSIKKKTHSSNQELIIMWKRLENKFSGFICIPLAFSKVVKAIYVLDFNPMKFSLS